MELSKYAKKELAVISEVFNAQNWDEKDKKEMISKVKGVLKKGDKLNYRAFEPKARWDFCVARLKSGDYTNWDGWDFRSGWSMTFHWGVELKCPLPKWGMEPVNHLVILGEQGIGDEILFLSALPELMVRYGREFIEFQTYPRLKSIVERSYGVECTDRKVLSEVVTGDAVMALGDLFPWYRRDKSHFPRKPYMKADPINVEHWKEWLKKYGDQPKVGVAWASSKGNVPAESLKTREGVYFDLQYRDPEVEVPAPAIPLESVPFDVKDDLENLFAFVKALDSVHSVTQTLCHVAGSQGVPCKAVLPEKVKHNLWYYYNGSKEPFWESPVYPNMTIYKTHHEFINHERRTKSS